MFNPDHGGPRPGGPPAPGGKMRFSDRLKSGSVEPLTHGHVAGQIRLGEQFRLSQQGDVARRMDLFPHDRPHGRGSHGDSSWSHHHGRIGASFYLNAFRYNYGGPWFYPYSGWYPRWSPWVDWSWHYYCPPYYDPRPFWCRPVIYVPSPVWVYYDVPVWQPLPVVAAGTWVDVPPAAVAPSQSDLQLLAVRFVDPGHPDEKTGPRYRVWLRNNGQQPVDQAFSVILLAGNDAQLTGDLPQAGAQVESIGAGETEAVDIRLPAEVNTMGRDADGKPAPFSTLHVLVDANRQIAETNEENNGATIARAEVLPVDPAAFAADLPSAPAGSEIVVAGEGFGPQPGQVLVHLGGVEMEAEILGWYDLGVRLKLPDLPLAGATQADLIVVRGDGAAANPVTVTILPPGAAAPPAPAISPPQ